MVGILDYGLAKVADLMNRHVITPAVGSISHSFSVEEQRLDSGDVTEAVLRITPLSGTQVYLNWENSPLCLKLNKPQVSLWLGGNVNPFSTKQTSQG